MDKKDVFGIIPHNLRAEPAKNADGDKCSIVYLHLADRERGFLIGEDFRDVVLKKSGVEIDDKDSESYEALAYVIGHTISVFLEKFQLVKQ